MNNSPKEIIGAIVAVILAIIGYIKTRKPKKEVESEFMGNAVGAMNDLIQMLRGQIESEKIEKDEVKKENEILKNRITDLEERFSRFEEDQKTERHALEEKIVLLEARLKKYENPKSIA